MQTKHPYTKKWSKTIFFIYYFLYNHLSQTDIPLRVSVRTFLKGFMDEEDSPRIGQHDYMDKGLGQNLKGKQRTPAEYQYSSFYSWLQKQRGQLPHAPSTTASLQWNVSPQTAIQNKPFPYIASVWHSQPYEKYLIQLWKSYWTELLCQWTPWKKKRNVNYVLFWRKILLVS